MKRYYIAVLILGSFLLSSCKPAPEPVVQESETLEANTFRLSSEAIENAHITVAIARPQKFSQSVVIQGDVMLNDANVAIITGQVDGVVKEIKKGLGDHVEKGETIATIISRSLADAQMAYVDTEHKLEFAKKNLEREKILREKELTSEEDYQKKVMEIKEIETAHIAALQQFRILGYTERDLHEYLEHPEEVDLSVFSLKSPFPGEIIKKTIKLGESVLADTELFQVADLSVLRVQCNVPTKYIDLLKVGNDVSITSRKESLSVEGEIIFISSIVDNATRTVPVKIAIDNSNRQWRPGMCVSVEIMGDQVELPLAVPKQSIQEINGAMSVFVQVDPTTFKLKRVTLGRENHDIVEITDGIEEGEKVVSENSFILKAEYLNQGVE